MLILLRIPFASLQVRGDTIPMASYFFDPRRKNAIDNSYTHGNTSNKWSQNFSLIISVHNIEGAGINNAFSLLLKRKIWLSFCLDSLLYCKHCLIKAWPWGSSPCIKKFFHLICSKK